MTRTLLLATAGMAALTSATAAAAQSAAPPATPGSASRTTVYPASFFAQYAPRTALDIGGLLLVTGAALGVVWP